MHAASHLRDACRALEASDPHTRRLVFWVLVVGALSSVFGAVDEEAWFVDAWAHVARAREDWGQGGQSRLMSWEEARADLRSVLWIDRILDEPGRKLHARLTAAVVASTASPRSRMEW